MSDMKHDIETLFSRPLSYVEGPVCCYCWRVVRADDAVVQYADRHGDRWLAHAACAEALAALPAGDKSKESEK